MEAPHPLLNRFVQKLHAAIKRYGGSERLFFEELVLEFYVRNPEMVDEVHTDWNNGNILHGMVMYVMVPHQLWLPTLSKAQQREAISVLMQLMSKFQIDDWGITPLELFQTLASFKDANRYSDLETQQMLMQVLAPPMIYPPAPLPIPV